jgi:hypothetical protein
LRIDESGTEIEQGAGAFARDETRERESPRPSYETWVCQKAVAECREALSTENRHWQSIEAIRH